MLEFLNTTRWPEIVETDSARVADKYLISIINTDHLIDD
jgi:hypothetical protein